IDPSSYAPLALLADTTPLASPEPPSARRELLQALLECLAREVVPQRVAEDELGVVTLPEQEVRAAPLAARADDQIGVVHLGRVQVGAEILLALPGECTRGVDDLGPAAVVEGHEQRDPR